MYRILPIVVLLLGVLSCHRQEKGFEQIYAPFLQAQTEWADSMLLEMTLDEKIGQLFALQSSENIAIDTLAKWVWNGQIGSWMPEGISRATYIHHTDTLQQIARIPLMMGTRQVIAINNQFSDGVHYPLPATISALKPGKQQQLLLDQYVEQCNALGVHFSLTPALNMADTTAGAYDFYALENDPEVQMFWSYKVMSQLQDKGIMSIGTVLKKIYYANKTDVGEMRERDSLMNQYYNLSQNGLSALFVDNRVLRADTNRFYPVGFLTKYLQESATFNGLLFGAPDSMTTVLDLLHAGVEVLVINTAPWREIAKVKKSLADGFITIDQINGKVRKILQAKTWLKLNKKPKKIEVPLVEELLAKEKHIYPIYNLYEEALTLANNLDSLIPFQNLNNKSFKLVTVGGQSMRSFEKTFKKYAKLKTSRGVQQTESGAWSKLDVKSLKTNTVILALTNVVLNDSDLPFIQSANELSKTTKVVLLNFGTPYNLRRFDASVTMVQAYELNKTTQSQVAQLLFGGLKAKGQLPLALADHLQYRQSFSNEVIRLKYGLSQEVGIAPQKLVDIDAIVHGAIRSGAMPGCQVMVVKEGNVIYDKNFGYFTYDKKQGVRSEHMYDIASVTKVAATSLAAMKLYESGRFRLDHKLDKLLELKNTRLKKISMKDLCTHRSGLQAFLPIASYLNNNKDTLHNGCNDYYCTTQHGDYNVRVASNMFFNKNHVDSLWNEIYQVKRKSRKRYLYSDLNFILLQRVLEKISGSSLDVYLNQNFYHPLNLAHTGYNPARRFPVSEIAPTAMDHKWRKEQVKGYVHDESATLLGGVAGNAGVFSNANDMAVLFQMLLNKGSYGGKEYLRESTVDLFTSRVRGSRGLGFEVKTKSGTGTCSPHASNGTYGHKGFTGTCVWVDPKHDLVFVFLTNRIYPNYKNNKLMRKKIRRRVHSVVYKAFDSYDLPVEELKEEAPFPAVAAWPSTEENCEG